MSCLLSSHSAPHRKEVKVQLLDLGPLQTGSQHALGVAEVQTEAGLSSGCPGDQIKSDETNTAHLIKVQTGCTSFVYVVFPVSM